jgi:hypothetical protein
MLGHNNKTIKDGIDALKKKDNCKKQQGSILIVSTFIVLIVSLICVSYWMLIRINTKMLVLKERNIQSYYAALGGIEDAISEIRNNQSWGSGDPFNARWKQVSGQTYYKSNSAGSPAPLSNFDHPTTISVTVIGDPSIETLNITCKAEVGNEDLQYTKTLQAHVIKSLSNEVHIIDIQGVSE